MRTIITNEILDGMIHDYHRGLSLDDLSKKFGLQNQSIQKRFKECGIYITKSKAVKFADEEIKNIVDDYKNGMRPFELEDKYKRDAATIIGKLKSLGIYNNSNHHYSKEDIDFIKKHYAIRDWNTIYERFPNISKNSIYTLMSRMNVSMENYYWSNADEILLKENYSKMYGHIKELVNLFNDKFSYEAITSKAAKLGLFTREYWSDDEICLLKEKYSNLTVDELMMYFPNRSRNSIISKAISLHLVNKVTIKNQFSEGDKKYIFEKYNNMTDKEIGKVVGRSDKSIRDFRLRNGLIKTYEKSSYNDLSEYVRRNNLDWKNASMMSCNYKCALTGERFDDIHHIHGLNLILYEALEELNIEVKPNMDDYLEDELRTILECFREKQSQYPLGICLAKNIHMKFHEIYGYGNNTELQWHEFKEDFESGKYVA